MNENNTKLNIKFIDQNYIKIQRLLDQIQHASLINSSACERLLQEVKVFKSFFTREHEAAYYFLQVIFLYKQNKWKEAQQIEEEKLKEILKNQTLLIYSDMVTKSYFYYLGIKYYFQNQLEESFTYFERFLSYLTDEREKAALYYNLSLISRHIEDYSEAIHYLKLALKVHQSQEDAKMITETYNSIGAVYLKLEKYPFAQKYFTKAAGMAKEYHYESILARILQNVALLHHYAKDFSLAEEAYLASIEIKKRLDLDNLLIPYKNLIRMYIKEKQVEKAIELLQEAKQFEKTDKEHFQLVFLEAETIKNSNPLLACDLYEQAISYFVSTNDSNELKGKYEIVADVYFKLENFKQAAIYLKKELEVKERSNS